MIDNLITATPVFIYLGVFMAAALAAGALSIPIIAWMEKRGCL